MEVFLEVEFFLAASGGEGDCFFLGELFLLGGLNCRSCSNKLALDFVERNREISTLSSLTKLRILNPIHLIVQLF